jgi:hypothetical protein
MGHSITEQRAYLKGGDDSEETNVEPEIE